MMDWPVLANPPGVEPGLKKVFQFNLIGRPNVYEGDCGEGKRIFVERDAKQAQILIEDEDDGWYIEDCNATGGNRASLHTDEVGKYLVYARILGKPGGELDICYGTLEDYEAGEDLCLIATFNMKRETGQSKFKIAPSAMFDAELEDLLWLVDTNKDYRISQFRVYKQAD
jgi:hypothetical protein